MGTPEGKAYTSFIPYSNIQWNYSNEKENPYSNNLVHIDKNEDDIDITHHVKIQTTILR